MPTLDPDSPNEQGRRCIGCGQRHELGSYDCDGIFVGYIDEEGLSWESCRERDCSITAGRYHDAFWRWNRSGGALGSEPDVREIAERVCREPDSIEEAIRDAERQFDPSDPLCALGIRVRAELARWN
jgi:hypothetical protein